jgi:hypothetical protein
MSSLFNLMLNLQAVDAVMETIPSEYHFLRNAYIHMSACNDLEARLENEDFTDISNDTFTEYCRNYDSTYVYSPCNATYDHGAKMDKTIRAMRRAVPTLVNTGLKKPPTQHLRMLEVLMRHDATMLKETMSLLELIKDFKEEVNLESPQVSLTNGVGLIVHAANKYLIRELIPAARVIVALPSSVMSAVSNQLANDIYKLGTFIPDSVITLLGQVAGCSIMSDLPTGVRAIEIKTARVAFEINQYVE